MSTYAARLEALNIETHDDGCQLECFPDSVWFLETNVGTETVSAEMVGRIKYRHDPESLAEQFADYIEGNRVNEAIQRDAWWAYWTMPGYLDRGSEHTGETESEALTTLLDCDGTCDDCSIPEWELSALERLAELADNGDAAAQQYLDTYLA